MISEDHEKSVLTSNKLSNSSFDVYREIDIKCIRADMIPITNDNNSNNIKKMQNNHYCNCITNSKTNAYINNNNYKYNKNENCI